MIYEFLADGFELVEAMTPVDMLRRAGADIKTVSITSDKAVKASNGVTVIADITLSEMGDILPDMVILPGGMPGASNLRACKKVCDLVCICYSKEIPIGAICAAPYILGELGLLKGKNATCYPGCEEEMGQAIMICGAAAVRDGRIITGTSAGCAVPFGLKLIEAMKGQAAADTVAKQIVIR